VRGGTVDLGDVEVMNAVVGLPYTANFQSAKLAYAAATGSAMTQKKRIEGVGLVLIDTHHQGVLYGQELEDDRLDDMPGVRDEEEVDEGTIFSEYDMPITALQGLWTTDSRLCLRAQAPKPATIGAAVIIVHTNEKAAA